MTGSALVQVAQRVQDLERAAAFYSALISSPPVAAFHPPGLVFFDLAGVRLLLEREAPSALLYLRVDDLESAVARVGGLEILSTAHRIFTHDTNTLGPIGQEEWQSFIRDPEGNTVGLVEFRDRKL
jgi:methylmalonyl-CoA/ethylmalonyl-CoA epimerase